MPVWSNISCPYWMGVWRLPMRLPSVNGLRPEIMKIGTSSERAFNSPITALASPTFTCTAAAAIFPVARK